jgi:hypothetical protein
VRRIALTVLFGIFLAMPSASADDPFLEEQCPVSGICAGPGTCTPVACVPRSCQPAAHCRSEVSSASECAINLTIQGETCQLLLGLDVRSNQGQEAWIGASLTSGHVDAFNLRNTWIVPSAEFTLSSGDLNVGDIGAGVYASRIFTQGEPGPVGMLAGASEHEYDHVAVVIHTGQGITSGETVLVGIYLLDFVPEGCYARTTTSSVLDCRDLTATLP